MPSKAFSIDRPNNLANDNKLDAEEARFIYVHFILSFQIQNVNTIQFSNERLNFKSIANSYARIKSVNRVRIMGSLFLSLQTNSLKSSRFMA